VAANLIELAKSYLTSEVVRRIGGALGESPDRVEKAVDAGIPSILAGFLNLASSSGANRVLELLRHEPSELAHHGGLDGVFGNLGSLLSEGSIDGLIKYGQTVLSSLFGGKLSSVVDLIARASGLKASSATSLLGMLAPLLMGVLRKETAARGSSPASLTDLLMSQKDAIAKLAPTGLSHAMGLQSLSELGSVPESIKMAGAGAAREVRRTAAAAADQGTAWLRWAAPLALLAVALLGLWYWSSTPREPERNPAPEVARETPAPGREVARATPPASDAVRNAAERATDTAARTTREIGDAGRKLTADGKTVIETVVRKVTLSLPGNIKLDVPENSYLQALVQSFTDGAGAREPKSFVADNLSFEGTTTKLTPDSSTAIASLATILKAFSNASLKIEGHTDNVGDPAQNKKLALDRATAIKDALVQAGAPADRIIVEGVGPDRPIASNDTEEGRAKNRRVELSVASR
jgi:OmpA-OmpF porin, OOP family